jgi:prevent-host-death family protein
MNQQVSIGQVKRDISELVNRVAFGKEHIVLTSRGRPKAVIISVEDYARFEQMMNQATLAQFYVLTAQVNRIAQQIQADQPTIDFNAFWQEIEIERESRDDHLFDL